MYFASFRAAAGDLAGKFCNARREADDFFAFCRAQGRERRLRELFARGGGIALNEGKEKSFYDVARAKCSADEVYKAGGFTRERSALFC